MNQVIVDEIRPAKKAGFSSVRFSQTGVAKTIQQIAFGSAPNRVAFLTFKNEELAKYGLKAGADMSQAIGQECRIAISEKTASQVAALPDNIRLGYQPKLNPSTKLILASNGETIFSRRTVEFAGVADELIKHDGEKAPSTEIEKIVVAKAIAREQARAAAKASAVLAA